MSGAGQRTSRRWLLAAVVVLGGARAEADVPALDVVVVPDTPLSLKLPKGWSARVTPPEHKTLSTVLSSSADCATVDVTLVVQLEQKKTSAGAVLKALAKGAKPTRQGAYECVADLERSEATCAGKVKGLPGVVAVTFTTAEPEPFTALGKEALALEVLKSVAWKGGAPEKLPEWNRYATGEAAASCPAKSP